MAIIHVPVVLLLLMHSTQVFAGRPLATDDAATVDVGTYEMEMGYDTADGRDVIKCRTAGVCLKHGITERLDFTIAVPYEIDPGFGLGRAAFCIKFALIRDSVHFPEFSFTCSSEVGGEGYTLNGIVSKDMGRFAMHFNCGYYATGTVNDPGIIHYSGALEVPVNDRLVLVGEIAGTGDDSAAVDDHIEGLFGGSLRVIEAIRYDVGVGLRFTDPSPEYHATSGITYSF